jgi:putative N6-adenine-specific DNA methylase
MYLYQKKNRYFAQIATGLEELAIKELTDLGAKNISNGFRGAYFDATAKALYQINYSARMVSRVLAPLTSFACSGRNDLYQNARRIDWCNLFSLEQTFAVFANVAHSRINHSRFAALCLKDAVVDTFRDHYGRRPNIDARQPNLWFNLYIVNDHATISLDTSGGPLHRRGYRRRSVKAPMQETLAAAIIESTQWQGERQLYDLMCGSGTLLCEALIKYCRFPAGGLRSRFGFEFLPDFNPTLWDQVKEKLQHEIRPLPKGIVAGSDNNPLAVKAARENCCTLPHGKEIPLIVKDYQQVKIPENSVIVCNPPYGVRMNSGNNLAEFYRRLGDYLKHHCKGSEAYVYFGEREFLKSIGLRPAWKKAFRNGGLDGRLAKFNLY